MSFRIESFIFTPSILLLPFAAAFYWVVSMREIHPDVIASRGRARLFLLGTLIAALAGAWAFGAATRCLQSDSSANSWIEVHLGSFGGYWGALLAGILLALLTKVSWLRVGDALVPGILIGGIVARLGCVFTGCCTGVDVGWPWLHGLQPFRAWPLYDIGALALTYGLMRCLPWKLEAFKPPGSVLGLFLVTYGMMRFGIEFLRYAPSLCGPLTPGQIACMVQIVVLFGVRSRLKWDRSKR